MGRLTGSTFVNRLADGAVSPFVISGRVPAYVTVSFGLDPAAPGPSRALSLRSLRLTTHAGGTVNETRRVRNDGASRATAVAAARVWYGRRGEVLGVGFASTTPSAFGPGAIGSFTITRPSSGRSSSRRRSCADAEPTVLCWAPGPRGTDARRRSATMAKARDKAGSRRSDRSTPVAPMREKLSRKVYDQELSRLGLELAEAAGVGQGARAEGGRDLRGT